MSKAPAQRPSAICHLIDGFELPATRGFFLSVVCSITSYNKGRKMEETAVNELDPFAIQMMEYNGAITMISLVALVITIIYSVKNGGIRETIENIFLWFLLFGGVFYISSYPVDDNDQITGAIFFVAFGLCRMAKHMIRKSNV